MPAYTLTQDWHIQAWNNSILKLLGWTDGYAKTLKANGRLSVLHIIFDPTLQLRPYLASEDGTWEEMAFRNVYTFKAINWLYQHDPWFMRELAVLKGLPNFTEYWRKTEVDIANPRLKAEFMSQITFPDNQIFRFRSLFISNGSFYYPHVGAYMPVDEASRQIMRDRGIPVITDYKLPEV